MELDNPPDDPRGESRLPPLLALLVAIVLPFLLPERLTSGPVWILSVLEGVILGAILLADPGRIDRRSGAIRTLSISLIVLVVLGSAFATARVIDLLLTGAPSISTASELLRTGALVWIYNNIAFALLYWELDGGGPANRLHDPAQHPDFAFPQQMSPELAPAGWRPVFLDYLYLGFTNALAFSPTDAMPLVHWAKVAMALQAVISVLILSLVVANAVNILG